jgi:nucleoside-diphosphate-sugar epimerase
LAESLRVGVVGTGYVGRVTGACLAHLGHRVTCVDRDEERVRGLRSGWMPVYEPGLEELVYPRRRPREPSPSDEADYSFKICCCADNLEARRRGGAACPRVLTQTSHLPSGGTE